MVSSTSQGPVVVVIGSTGAQGGSVISHLLRSDRPYQLRAITRDVSKPAAKKLESQGVQLVQADTEKSSDLDRAFEGASIVFGLTNFWAHMSLDQEVADGKRIVDAIKKAGVKLFVWSGVEHVEKISKGKIAGVEHFDSKGLITAYAKEVDVPLLIVSPGCYMSNFASPYFNMAPRKLDDGSIVLSLPVPGSTVISLLNAEADYGAYVREALEAPQFDGKAGQEVLASSDEKTLEQMVQEFNEVTGANARYEQVSEKDWIARFGEQGEKAGVELAEMLRWFAEYGYYGGKDIKPSQEGLAVPVSTWKDFVKKQKWDVLA